MTQPKNERDIFAEVVMGMPTPAKIAGAMVSTPPSASVSRRWGTINAINGNGTVDVNIGGILVPGARRVAHYVPTVGETVMIDIISGDFIVAGTLPPSPKNDLASMQTATTAVDARATAVKQMTRAQHMLTGGGLKSVTTAREIRWNDRFIAISMERGPGWATDGFFDIFTPPDGTVITNISGGSNVTVTSRRITLPAWGALWYIPPIGNISTSVAANFRITQNNVNNFTIPDSWILIAVANEDSRSPLIKWGSGETSDPWYAASLQNGWVNYGAGLQGAIYSRDGNGVIEIEGLVVSGTAPLIFTLPIGFRPGADIVFGTAAGEPNQYGRFNVGASGNVDAVTWPAGGWISITCSFRAEA